MGHHRGVSVAYNNGFVNTLKPTACCSYCAHTHLLSIIHWRTYDNSTTYRLW